MCIFCFSLSCILLTDMGGDRPATIIWACLCFFLTKVNLQGFDSITTSPNIWMLVIIVFRPPSILYDSLVWFRLSLLIIDCRHVSWVSTYFSIKTSDISNEIEQLINEMTEIICKIRQNRETNSSAVREQKIIIENEIREFRTKINNHL
jgi:hypothetical protein